MTDVNAPAARDFSATLALPHTDFPMRANLPAREPGWVQRWLDNDVYGALLAKRRAEGAPTYIVHLGPPYANGNFHMGHVLTYVLKDFVVRSKFMAGYASPYVPGWDCHGLPIEWKIEQDLRAKGQTKHDVSVMELRALCRAYANTWIGVQKSEWQRFGALGDWDRPYKTMDKANEAGIVRELGKLVQRGLVSQQLRSTQWSWAEETAMAEAEVEYKDVTSTAVYVAVPLVGRADEHLVIWTTTPWTLPANRAVAVNVAEDYVCVAAGDKHLWVAAKCREAFAAAMGATLGEPVASVRGADMVGWTYEHPLYGTVQPVVEGFHVTTDAGTGLVHIAPAHGAEDFVIGKQFGLPLECPVDGAGKYLADVPALPHTQEPLAGLLIWPAQKRILAELEATGRLLKATDFPHSYPVSWRSKEKLIFRTTAQWFVALDKPLSELGDKTLREASLDRIYGRDGVRGVQWVPGYGQNRIGAMIEGRPDWCISRQRAWGVPITIIRAKNPSTPMDGVREGLVVDTAVWDHVVALVAAEGIDAWDSRLGGREAELFPAGWLEARGVSAADFDYVRDILDVWFDSGTTHAHVVRADSAEGQRFARTDGKRPADLYQEGSDQHRGWFHSSLLTSVAAYGDAPYETVMTSGFVVDGQGRKFSKSLGNGVEPRALLDKYGMDIIRLWVAKSDTSEDIRYSPAMMDVCADDYRKFRNTLRWLLGNMGPLGAPAVAPDAMPELERYMLHRLSAVLAEVRGHYSALAFHKATRALYDFCSTELSNFYFDVRKDTLYCDAADSPARRACVAALDHIFRGLVTHLAPLMPFTTDEAWRSRFGDDACVHLETFALPPEVVVDGARWEALMGLRDAANRAIEALRAEGRVGANMDVALTYPEPLDADVVREVCGVSAARHGGALQVAQHDGHKCPRCWRYYDVLEASGVCARCDGALVALDAARATAQDGAHE